VNSGTPEGSHFPVPLVVPVTLVHKFVNLIQPFLFHYNLQFVLIEMLDKLITYIVCWYNTLYQVMDGVVITTNGTYPWS
jgi:hypothetical protein